MSFQELLRLNSRREITCGSIERLQAAIQHGGDLRIYTRFLFNEHIEPGSRNKEPVDEVSDFRVTYCIDERFVAGIMNLRMPVHPPYGFGPDPSWSFFLYNQDGSQCIARPYLDGRVSETPPPCGMCPPRPHGDMPKYHEFSNYDEDSNAPCSNFIYDFEEFGFFVNDRYQEVFSHDEAGTVLSGSFEDLIRAFRHGCDLKLAISNLNGNSGKNKFSSELFTFAGPGYHNVGSGIFCVSSQPTVVVDSDIPMRYETGNWSFGNIFVRTDGLVEYWRCDPYTLRYEKRVSRNKIRYLVNQN